MSKQENSPEQLESSREISGALKTTEMGKINLSISEIIEIYNHVPRVLARKVIKVSPTNNYYLDHSQKQIFLTAKRNSNYWVITTEDNTSYLLPKNNLIINTFNLDTVKSLFNCEGSEQLDNKEFTVSVPAKISLMPNGKEWKLEEKGTLDFDPDSSELKLRSQLEQTNQKCEQLQSQLIEKEKECQQLTSQVAQLASEQLQEIRSHLVTKNELEKNLKQTAKEHQQLQEKLLFIEQKLQIKAPPQLSQIKSNTDNQIHLLQTRLEEIEDYLENYLEDNQINTQDTKTYQSESQRPTKLSLSGEEHQLVEQYNNHYLSTLLTRIIEVSETQKSISDRSIGASQTVTLEEKHRGRYGIITQGNYHYLVPSKSFRITDNNYKTVQALFRCSGYQRGHSERFELIKPAKVSSRSSNQQWQLEEPGILEFI